MLFLISVYVECVFIHFSFQYTFTELTRNLILAGVSVFVVVLLFVVDLRSALFVVLCVAFTMVSAKHYNNTSLTRTGFQKWHIQFVRYKLWKKADCYLTL